MGIQKICLKLGLKMRGVFLFLIAAIVGICAGAMGSQGQLDLYIYNNILDRAPLTYSVPHDAMLMVDKLTPAKLTIGSETALYHTYGHPDFASSGYRFVFYKDDLQRRENFVVKLRSSGFLQEGDIILKFHPEWGFTGGYPTIVGGISHAGLMYRSGGQLFNLDMPLDDSFLKDLHSVTKKSSLSSQVWASEARFIHILRPRGLTEQQKVNLNAWAEQLIANRDLYYGSVIKFNPNYLLSSLSLASIRKGHRYYGEAAKDLARVIQEDLPAHTWLNPLEPFRENLRKAIYLFCSDFVWSFQSLKNCNVAQSVNQCQTAVPFAPLDLLGRNLFTDSGFKPGIVDLPYLVYERLLRRAKSTSDANKLLSQLEKDFLKLKAYKNIGQDHLAAADQFLQWDSEIYSEITDYTRMRLLAHRRASKKKRTSMLKKLPELPSSFPPHSFLINALLLNDSDERSFDYVATLSFVRADQWSHLNFLKEN